MLRHQPVMVNEMLASLPKQCSYILDGTLGHGGHTQQMLELSDRNIMCVVGVDRDGDVLLKTQKFLANNIDKLQIIQTSYSHLESISEQSGIDQFDYMLLDIGVNMEHFKDGDRGFSIKLPGVLDMRYDRSAGSTAKQRLDTMKFSTLNETFEKYTDFNEKYRIWITEELLVAHNKHPFTTTSDLQQWANNLGINDKKLAVIFQAIRIAVNNELGELEQFLKIFIDYLQIGGRCGIMTYHSIEDRMVKVAFKDLVEKQRAILYNKKVIQPQWEEIKRNKAARSAKFRILERLI